MTIYFLWFSFFSFLFLSSYSYDTNRRVSFWTCFCLLGWLIGWVFRHANQIGCFKDQWKLTLSANPSLTEWVDNPFSCDLGALWANLLLSDWHCDYCFI